MTANIYSGAGNSFVMLDFRAEDALLSVQEVTALCREYSTDGLVILRKSTGYDFRMLFYNPDGTSGMMCGNGGRCAALFARRIGIAPADADHYEFEAPDGIHSAWITRDDSEASIVRLSMKHPRETGKVLDGYFTDTGARHFVKFVSDVSAVDVPLEGRRYRVMQEFAPQGTNVDFVQAVSAGTIRVRTFEKGVEAETFSCGTGVAASAFVYNHIFNGMQLHASLSVLTASASFQVEITPGELYLTGPVEIHDNR